MFTPASSVVTNAVVLVLGEYQISIPTYLWGISTPHIQLYCNVLGIDNAMPV